MSARRIEGPNPGWYSGVPIGRRRLLMGGAVVGTAAFLGGCENQEESPYKEVKLDGYYPGFVAIRNGSIQEGALTARISPQVLKDNSNTYIKMKGNGGLWGIQGIALLKEGDGPVPAMPDTEMVGIKNPGIVRGQDGNLYIPLQLETYQYTQFVGPNGAKSNRYTRSKNTWYVRFDSSTESDLIPVDDMARPLETNLNTYSGVVPVTTDPKGKHITKAERKPISELGKGIILR